MDTEGSLSASGWTPQIGRNGGRACETHDVGASKESACILRLCFLSTFLPSDFFSNQT